MKLSILIASLPSRSAMLECLLLFLYQQSTHEVEIIFDDSVDINIGSKRNILLTKAKGDYIVFIDDDDVVSDKYIPLILEAIKTNPDCIGISGIITTNGVNKRVWHISKDYKSWFEKNDVYYRTPNHISPVKRELAMRAGFPQIEHGEDYEYSMRLLPLLTTEVKIKEPLYHYQYVKKGNSKLSERERKLQIRAGKIKAIAARKNGR